MKIRITLFLLLSFVVFRSVAGEKEQVIARANYQKYFQNVATGIPDKVMAVQQYRSYFSKTPYRAYTLKTSLNSWKNCFDQLNDEGQFRDLMKQEENIKESQILSELRDTFIPKLMSGELNV